MLQKNARVRMPAKPIYCVLAVLVFGGIMLPCCVTVGVMSYVMTQALAEVGSRGNGILYEMQILSVFSMVFGMLVVFNMLYFSSDREHLVTFPVQAHHLMTAKFLFAYLMESAMEFPVLLAALIGYFAALAEGASCGAGALLGQVSPVSWVAALCGIFLVPLVPMLYCGMFSVVLMACLKRVRSAQTFYRISGVCMLGFAALFLYSLRGMGQINIENYVEALGSGQDLFLRTMNVIFFPVPWFTAALDEVKAGYLLLYLGMHVALFLLFVLLGKQWYQQGLYTVGALGNAAATRGARRPGRRHSLFVACLLRELRVLLRTRAFAGNCVYVNLIWPAGTFALFYFTSDHGNLASFVGMYRIGKERAELAVMLALLFAAFIATAMNSLSSTAFSREGKQIGLLKYIPVPYMTQLRAKACASAIFTMPALLAMEGIAAYYLGMSLSKIVFYAALMLAAHMIASAVGMLMDSGMPYVTWDDEYSALRGNVSTFFNMAVMMFAAGAVIGLSLLLYEALKWPLPAYSLLVFVVLWGTAVGTVLLTDVRILENMEDLDCG
ncbi:MAG: hypothetical protein IJ747_07770 [Lachnospiraceae bacterium]|nr:hypothetical protein [Lachnospiraceae bacterium]